MLIRVQASSLPFLITLCSLQFPEQHMGLGRAFLDLMD